MVVLETVYLIAVYNYVLAEVITDEAYILNFDSPIYVCSDEDSQKFIDTSQVEVKRHNETTTYMTGSINFLKGIQTATMLKAIIEKDVGGSFEMFASHEICDLCKEIRDKESSYAEYWKCFGFSEQCPFPPNTFAIHDFVANTKDLPINSATAGRYQVTINIYNNPESNCLNEKKIIACLKLDFIIEPL